MITDPDALTRLLIEAIGSGVDPRSAVARSAYCELG